MAALAHAAEEPLPTWALLTKFLETLGTISDCLDALEKVSHPKQIPGFVSPDSLFLDQGMHTRMASLDINTDSDSEDRNLKKPSLGFQELPFRFARY